VFECGGFDTSCWEINPDLAGEWNFVGLYEYDNGECSGEGILAFEEWQCSYDGNEYYSEEECLDNCSESCYPDADAPTTIGLNDDGSGYFSFPTEVACLDDSDCDVLEYYYVCSDYNPYNYDGSYDSLEECQANCQSDCESMPFFDEASCNDSGYCEATFSMIWGEYDGLWCYYPESDVWEDDGIFCVGPIEINDEGFLVVSQYDEDSCEEYTFELDSEEVALQYFTDLPNETGESSLIIIQGGIDLEVGDEVGLFDSDGLVDGDGNTGEILVGSAVWTGEQLNVVGIGSVDLSEFGGPILPGYVDGNDIVYKVWKASEDAVYDAEATSLAFHTL
jgi:hypothetical protein